jgi:hypothetical protein
VADSTRLWEWNPSVMDSAIDLHNTIVRQLLDEHGGHEIRNEGGRHTGGSWQGAGCGLARGLGAGTCGQHAVLQRA